MNTQPANFVLTIACDDRTGIVAAVANSIASQDCNITESAQYGDPETNRFFMRVAFAAPGHLDEAGFRRGFTPVATAYALDWRLHDLTRKPRMMILVSKLGHCLNDLLYRHAIGQLPAEITSVASNHADLRRRVENEGLAFHHLPVTAETKAGQEAQIMALVEEQGADLIVLARYMQILSDDFSRRLYGRIINIHHSFLPSFKGAKPYHRAHKRGVKLIGATAHYVTPDLDEGPIIEQDVARVEHFMTPETFVALGRDVESQVLARAVRYHLEHRILLNGDRTVIFK